MPAEVAHAIPACHAMPLNEPPPICSTPRRSPLTPARASFPISPLRSPSASVENSDLAELIDRRDWSAVLERLETHKSEAGDAVRHGFQDESLPLHEACKLQPPAAVVAALISANSNAVRTPGTFSNLPLHFAARSDSAAAVEILIKDYPGAARRRDDAGKLPLHLACQWGARPAVVDLILRIYPEGIYVRDSDGKKPMEYAKALKEVITPLKDEIVKVMNDGGAYCSVSKAAYARAKEELDSKARALGKAHAVDMKNLERKHAEEKKISKEAEDALKVHANILEMKLNEKTIELRNALKNEEAMKTRMKETAVFSATFESIRVDLEKKTRALEQKELELLESYGRVAALQGNLFDAAQRDDRNLKKIDELSRTVLSLSASISALVANETLIKRATEEQAKAVKMVLATEESGMKDKLSKQQKKVVNEANSLERLLRSAEPRNVEQSFWEEIEHVNIVSDDMTVPAFDTVADSKHDMEGTTARD